MITEKYTLSRIILPNLIEANGMDEGTYEHMPQIKRVRYYPNIENKIYYRTHKILTDQSVLIKVYGSSDLTAVLFKNIQDFKRSCLTARFSIRYFKGKRIIVNYIKEEEMKYILSSHSTKIIDFEWELGTIHQLEDERVLHVFGNIGSLYSSFEQLYLDYLDLLEMVKRTDHWV